MDYFLSVECETHYELPGVMTSKEYRGSGIEVELTGDSTTRTVLVQSSSKTFGVRDTRDRYCLVIQTRKISG